MSDIFQEFNEYMIANNFKCYSVTGTDASYVNTDLIEYIITHGVINDTEDAPKGENYL